MTPIRTVLPAIGLALAFGGSALAQTPPTPEQAKALESQITSWLSATTGGLLKLPVRPVQLTPEGDHYVVRVPLAPAVGKIDPADAAFTATTRQLDGSRWSLDDQQFPPDFTLSTTETVPDPPDAKNPSPDGTHKEDVTFHIKLGKQDVQGVIDTSRATPTTSGGTVASVDIVKEGGSGASTTHIGPTTSQTSASPVDPTHSNFVSDASAQGYTLTADLPDGSGFTLQADRLHIASALSGLAQGQLAPLLRLVGEVAKTVKAPGGDTTDGPTPEQKAQLHDMLQKAHDILTGARLDESVEGATFDFAGNRGSLAKAQITLGGDAPADTLSASMGFLLDGLTIDNLPPPLAAYVPTHFAIHPTLSNLSVGALTRMGLDATAPLADGQAPPVPDTPALFANGGIKFGFDGLALDVAGAQLSGTGSFTSTGPKSITGQSDLAATGLDGLITKAQQDPVLQQVVPVIIFLKGIARTTGDQAVWQITVDNAKVLVNGVDLSAMAGAMNK